MEEEFATYFHNGIETGYLISLRDVKNVRYKPHTRFNDYRKGSYGERPW